MSNPSHVARGIAALGLTVAGTMTARAAVPESVTTALDAAAADGITVGGMVLVVVVGIVAFKYLRKAL